MIFHKRSIQLASLYLAILMAISIFFSATLYNSSMRELDRGLRRPAPEVSVIIGPGYSQNIRQQLEQAWHRQYEEAHDRLLTELVLINMMILIGGGMLSYYLALRTLKPIEDAHEAQSRFTADASHELRTPITAMRTENEVALMDPKLTLDDAKAQLSSNIEELEKLGTLTEGLLRLARLENNQLEKQPTTASDLLNEAVDRVLPRAERKHILISTRIQHDAQVLADRASLTEALVTIIDNAVKYSPEKTEIVVSVGIQQRTALFRVKDRGIGISAAELPHIFERFYRADSSRTKQQTEGYGLGLAIARSVAEAHNGTLTAKSSVGRGSTFTLSIPTL